MKIKDVIRVDGIEFTDDIDDDNDPYLIASYGCEGGGKTQFGLTMPETIGCVPLDEKANKTITKCAKSMGKSILKPRPIEGTSSFIKQVTMREMVGMPEDKCKDFYGDRVQNVYAVVHALLGHDDVRALMIDTFGQLCTWIEFWLNGGGNGGFAKTQVVGNKKVVKDKSASNDEIIRFLRSLKTYKKPVLLTHKWKDQYENDKVVGKRPEGFNWIGNHCNIVIEHTNATVCGIKDADYKWGLAVRTCQDAPLIEDLSTPLLTDGDITFAELIMRIDPNADMNDLV